MKALFITNINDLKANILGGVQLCSQEFLEVIRLVCNSVQIFEVDVAKDLKYRFIRKIGLDYYHIYNAKQYKINLIQFIQNNEINTVFINKAELMRFSKIIKDAFGNKVKVVLMSHGNETGDFLHQLSHPNLTIVPFKLLKNKFRLGLNLYIESYFRHRFIDLVCAMSAEEEAIEKWLGSKNTFFFPRLIHDNKIIRNAIPGRIGFVGTLNHTPNIIALEEICKILKQNNFSGEFRIVGSGETEGKLLFDKYKFVTYCGRLNDNELKQELSTWVCFLNPIFWYSRGASMKLAQALGWGLPVISTIAGARGYKFKNDFLILTSNNGQSFVTEVLAFVSDYNYSQNESLDYLNLIYSPYEIAEDLKKTVFQL